MSGKVVFDTQHLYYLPQYLPVAALLSRAGIYCEFILYKEPDLDLIKNQALDESGYAYRYLNSTDDALGYYQNVKADWILFGNVPKFSASQKASISPKLALMQHGIGPKSCYYDVSKFPFDVRFVEGNDRLSRLQTLYPDRHFEDVGFAKLDPVFDGSSPELCLQSIGLDPTKPTILYAPTFFPSSIEHFKADWPAELSDYNLLIKPHFFSLTKSKYNAHRERFNQWSSYSNVYVASISDYNLLPFMQVADIMLSDASSAIFEFVAMDKPVVWCDFYQTRWKYKGIFRFRLTKRLDPDIQLFSKIAFHAKSARSATKAIAEQLNTPGHLQQQRQQVTETMVGRTDGQCSQRIVNYLTQHSSNLASF